MPEKFVNIMSDKRLTIGEIEQTYYKRYYKSHTIPPVQLKQISVMEAIHRVEPEVALE
jgi:hypothetical protein